MSHATETFINGINTGAVEQLIHNVSADVGNGKANFCVATKWRGGTKTETNVSHWKFGGQIQRRSHSIHSDEPRELAGTDTQPNPQEILLAGLNACMMVGYAALASLKGIVLESLEIETEGELDLRGFLALDPGIKPGYEELRYTVRIKGNGTSEQFREIHDAVMATSPNFSNLATAVKLVPKLAIV